MGQAIFSPIFKLFGLISKSLSGVFVSPALANFPLKTKAILHNGFYTTLAHRKGSVV